MTGEVPDEEKPESQFSFWGNKNWYARYNYKSMRGDIPRSQPNYAEIYKLSFLEVFKALKGRQRKKKIYAHEEMPEMLKIPVPLPEKITY